MSFVLLALLLPQTGEARRCPQFQRLRLLLAGNLNGLEKTFFGFRLGSLGLLGLPGRLRLCKRQLAFQPIQLRLVATLPSFVY